MSDHVYWIIEADIVPGKLDELKSLMQEMSAATEADEPGALNYEWSLSADETECHIFERYQDSDATMVHMGNFGSKFAKQFMSVLKPKRCRLYGAPDERVQKAMKPLGAVYLASAAGFSR
ncbi:putative quinol monooxygenase [Sneathiella glossodoripedis]|uniref:putative quinol monooxygenase n=1 Tax=Sneathiella glossodoripedis TaxID=418853 RepID=UPI0004706A9D|nr:antibiotic biosynthesis monooxygenase [Sneathiella glossodoripedis]